MGKSLVCCFFDSQCEVYRRRDLRTNGGGTPGRSSTQCKHDKLASTADRCRQLEVIDARRYDRSLLDEVSAAAAVAEAAAGWAVCAQSSDKTSTRRQSVTHSATVAPSRLPSVI